MKRDSPDVPILARGDRWAVVAKPPRVIVHRNPHAKKVDALLQRVRDQLGMRVNLVHRLDRNASGCLLVATDSEMAGALSACLSAPDSQKTYVAFVRGHYNGPSPTEVRTPVKTDTGPKESWSTVECLGRTHRPRSSLMRVFPHTGRHHQVRRHVRDLGHPIICDGDHGDSRVNRWWRENHDFDRLGLHAISLEMTFPDGERRRIECPLFQDHQRVWSTLPWWERAVEREPILAREPFVWWGQDGMDLPQGRAQPLTQD